EHARRLLVLRSSRDGDVRATREDGGRAAVGAGQYVDAEDVVVPRGTDSAVLVLDGVADAAGRPARGDDRGGLRSAGHVVVVDVHPRSRVRLGGGSKRGTGVEVLQLLKSSLSGRARQRGFPRVAVLHCKLAAVGEDPRDAVAPVRAANVEAGLSVGLEGRRRLAEFSKRGRDLEAGGRV